MAIQRLGIHESVNEVFPAAKLVDALDDVDPAVELLTDADTVTGFDAIVTFAYKPEFLELQWIHSIQAGVDRFPFDELERHDVILTNSTGIHGDSVGETVAGYMLMFARRLHDAVANQQHRTWDRPEWDEAFTLRDLPVCIVGLGTLGRGVADRANGLGMRVTGVKRTVEPVDGVDRVFPSEELVEAIEGARFVIIAVPLTKETEKLIGAEAFEAMRPDAYLINVARGGVVDHGALRTAIRTGSIAGAALDVFESEPLPSESALWSLDDVIITPHIAGVTRDYYANVATLVRENIEHVAAGSSITNRIV